MCVFVCLESGACVFEHLFVFFVCLFVFVFVLQLLLLLFLPCYYFQCDFGRLASGVFEKSRAGYKDPSSYFLLPIKTRSCRVRLFFFFFFFLMFSKHTQNRLLYFILIFRSSVLLRSCCFIASSYPG